MEEQNQLLIGRPELRSQFEHILVKTTEDKIESLTSMEVLALKVGTNEVIYPSRIGKYPGVLKSFISRSRLYDGKIVSTFIATPLLSTLTDQIISFYRINLMQFIEDILKIKEKELSFEIHSVIKNKVEEEFINDAFKLSVEEVLNNSVGNIIVSTFISLGTTLLATLGMYLIFGTSAATVTAGIGALVLVGIITNEAVTFKEKFKNRVCFQIKSSSHEIYNELNSRLYDFLKRTGFLNDMYNTNLLKIINRSETYSSKLTVDILQEYKDLLKDNKVKETLDILLKEVDKNCEQYNQIIHLKQRWSQNEKNANENLISTTEENQERSKIVNSILKIIDSLSSE